MSTLPIAKWILFCSLLLAFLLVVLAFWAIRPKCYQMTKPNVVSQRSQRIWTLSSLGVFCLMVVICHKPLIQLKRHLQFSEEPVVQFLFGNLWAGGNEMAFDRKRFVLGERDRLCADTLLPKTISNAPNVVIILMDAGRRDHMPPYGYYRNTMPFVQSMYESGKLRSVDHAYASATNTVGSLAGMFYSRDWDKFGYNGFNLFEYMQMNGFQTYAILTGYHRDWYGLSAMYRPHTDHYFESPKDLMIPGDDDLITIDHLESLPLKTPFFLYLHLLSTHAIGRKHTEYKQYTPDKVDLTTNQTTAFSNNHDNGLLQTDAIIERVFAKLKTAGIADQTVVYIISDHGELLGEEGRFLHTGNVHPLLLHVPWLIWDRDTAFYKNTQQATLLDVGPTIAHRIGLQRPACWSGISLGEGNANRVLEINSSDPCDYPTGTLHLTDSAQYLIVRNPQGVPSRLYRLNGSYWSEAKDISKQ